MGMGVDNTLAGHQDHFDDNVAIVRGSSVGSPQCAGVRTEMSGNRYFTGNGNISLCGKPLAEAQKEGLDQGSTVSWFPRDDVILGWARTLLWSSLPGPVAVVIV